VKRRFLAPILIGLLALAACGDDDGADVRSLGGDECASGSASASASGASASGASASGCASGSASGSASAASGSASGSDAAAGECEVVGGVDAAEDGEGHVTLDEWSVALEESELAAGIVKLEATNAGEDAHELVIVRGATADLPIVDGVVDEEGLPEGDFIGEIEPFDGECEGTFELTAGTYTLFCAIVEEEEDGTVENHYELGMVTEVEVG
jgi:hypothetical protein